ATDANGCYVIETVTISEPSELEITIEIDYITSIETIVSVAEVIGGVAPYQFSLNGNVWQSDSIFYVSEGIHQIEVKDSNGCSLEYEFVVSYSDENVDGIPDYYEDVNRNGILEDDDTDKDGIPDYLDNDDDGDNVDSIHEIAYETSKDASQKGDRKNLYFIDTDNDGIPDYL